MSFVLNRMIYCTGQFLATQRGHQHHYHSARVGAILTVARGISSVDGLQMRASLVHNARKSLDLQSWKDHLFHPFSCWPPR